MTDIPHKSVEPLLWFVHDNAMSCLTQWRQESRSVDDKLAQIMMVLADLTMALAGGYRPDGVRQ